MNSRASLLMLGLLVACQMENPAFEGGADEVGDDGTGGTVDSGESVEEGTSAGESTSASESTSDDMTTSPDTTGTTTDGECLPGTSCGSCHVCNVASECVPNTGADCADVGLNCADYLFGPEESSCYTLVGAELKGTCSDQGVCEQPSPTLCPMEKGEVHFACDPECVTNNLGCTPFALAAIVDMSAMCAVDGEGPGCKSFCSNLNGSSIHHNQCSMGECTSQGQEICSPYACDADSVQCLGSCVLPSDCSLGFVCMDSDCVLP